MKVCCKKDCLFDGDSQSLDNFSKDKYRKDGLYPQCKTCNKMYQESHKEQEKKIHHKYYEKNKEKIITRAKLWAKNHPEQRAINSRIKERRRRALKVGLNENYTLEDEQITIKVFGNRCFNCNKKPKKITIDHHIALTRGKPLTVDNAVPLCRSCNTSKYNHFPEEVYTKQQLREIKKLFKKALKLKKGKP